MRRATTPCSAHRAGSAALRSSAKLGAEFVEQAGEAPRRGLIGRAHIRVAALRLHDQIDRTILQMQPLAVSKQRDLREPCHARRPGIGQGIGRISALSFSDASGRT